MTTSSRNYNRLALMGYDMDDMEYVKEFDVPSEFAYTKDINEWMLDKIMTESTDGGMPLEEARMHRMKSQKEIEELYKLHDL